MHVEAIEPSSALADPLDVLSPEERTSYANLKDSFTASPLHDRRIETFQQEISRVLRFVDMTHERRERRALAVGLIFTGSYFCVNTQQLRRVVGRCKTSINNGFKMLGFVSMKMKAPMLSFLVSALPSLIDDTIAVRQWTVRSFVSAHQPSTVVIVKPAPQAPLPVPAISIPLLSKPETRIDRDDLMLPSLDCVTKAPVRSLQRIE